MGLSERYLVWRLQRRDREACRELIRRHHGGVYGYVRRLGADPSLAEDLTQETYAKAWRSIETLRESASLRSWLLTIARNEFFQWMRAKRPEAAPVAELPDGDDGGPDPHERLVDAERDRAVRSAVARLEPALRETVALHYFHELSFREVGSVLGIPVGTVKSRLHRALGCVRASLERKEADHEGQRAGKALAGHS